jgi:hypothetical protein
MRLVRGLGGLRVDMSNVRKPRGEDESDEETRAHDHFSADMVGSAGR